MIEFRLPSLGSDMDDGVLVQWHVRAGDAVRKGQVLAVVDTTKAAIDVECWDEGTVHALVAEPGQRLPVGATLAVLRAPGESSEDAERAWATLRASRAAAAAAKGASADARAATSAAAPAAASAAASAVTSTPPPARAPGAAALPGSDAAAPSRRVSPAARRLAHEHGLDAASVAAAGDVVSLADVQAALDARTARALPCAPTPASRAQAMRQTIAAAMSRSKREIPHYYLTDEIDFAAASAWLARRNAGLAPAQRLLPAALLLKAVARALARYPEFNGFWRDGAFVRAGGIHLGVAVSLREGGLVAPALHDAERRDVATLTRALLDLVKRTRAGALRSSELADATITVTNLGEQGVASVFGVIYPPQVALVGFGRIAPRPVVADDGTVQARPMLTATLAADHRTSDGHRGALLLAAIGEMLREPEALDRAGTTETATQA